MRARTNRRVHKVRKKQGSMSAMAMPLARNSTDRKGWMRIDELELDGTDAQEVPNYAPTHHELCVLVKHGMTEIIITTIGCSAMRPPLNKFVAWRPVTGESIESWSASAKMQSSVRLVRHTKNTVKRTTPKRGVSF